MSPKFPHPTHDYSGKEEVFSNDHERGGVGTEHGMASGQLAAMFAKMGKGAAKVGVAGARLAGRGVINVVAPHLVPKTPDGRIHVPKAKVIKAPHVPPPPKAKIPKQPGGHAKPHQPHLPHPKEPHEGKEHEEGGLHEHIKKIGEGVEKLGKTIAPLKTAAGTAVAAASTVSAGEKVGDAAFKQKHHG